MIPPHEHMTADDAISVLSRLVDGRHPDVVFPLRCIEVRLLLDRISDLTAGLIEEKTEHAKSTEAYYKLHEMKCRMMIVKDDGNGELKPAGVVDASLALGVWLAAHRGRWFDVERRESDGGLFRVVLYALFEGTPPLFESDACPTEDAAILDALGKVAK